MTRRSDLMCEDLFGCDHEPEVPVSEGGAVVEWMCRCGRRVRAPEKAAGARDDVDALVAEILRRTGDALVTGLDEGRVRSIVAALGGVDPTRRALPRFGRTGGHAIPSLPGLQWLDWETADAIEAAWNAAEGRAEG